MENGDAEKFPLRMLVYLIIINTLAVLIAELCLILIDQLGLK